MFKLFTAKNLLFTLALTLMAVGQGFALTCSGSPKTCQISSCQDLHDFSDSTNVVKFSLNSHPNVGWNAKVTQPIDMADCKDGNGNIKPFTPIASKDVVLNAYSGTFDGQGFPISNLNIVGSENTQYVGMFAGLQSGGVIKNLVLENISISASKDKGWAIDPTVGSVVGFMHGSSSVVQNCYVSGTVVATGEQSTVGGVVGKITGGTIENTLSDVDIYASNNNVNVGGIVGQSYDNGLHNNKTIQYCVYDGQVIDNSGNGASGGLVGTSNDGRLTITNSFYDSDVVLPAIGSNSGNTNTNTAKGNSDVNTPAIVCQLNGGTWDTTSSTCENPTQDVWSNGDNITNTGVSKDDNGQTVYMVTFSANGGSFPSGANTFKQLPLGAKITSAEITEPSKADYKFLGWSTQSNATTASTDLGNVQRKTTIYAVWQAITYVTVTFDANGGKFANNKDTMQVKYAQNAPISSPTEVPVDYNSGEGENLQHHVFMGWSADNLSSASVLGSFGNATGNLTFYAVWQTTTDTYYTVTFNANNHGVAPASLRVKEGVAAAEPTDPTADDYEFGGWYTDADWRKGEVYDFSSPVNGNVTLYAKWTPKNYTISFNVGTGVPAVASINYTVESADIELPTATWDGGHVFDGWFYDAAYTEPANTIVSGTTGNITLYAKWSVKTYVIKYLAGNYGSGIIEDGIKSHGQTFTLSSTQFSKLNDNFNHNGWALTDGGSKAYDLGGVLPADFNEDLTLYPYWEGYITRYTILYKYSVVDNHGTVLVNDSTMFSETGVMDIQNNTHKLQNALEREGYTFSGWTDVKLTGTETSVAVSDGKITVTGNTTAKGVYSPKAYSITYNGMEGASFGSATAENSYYITSAEITLLNPTKSGSVFKGWFDNANYFGEAITKILSGSTGNKVFYAKWEDARFITVKNEAGTESFGMEVSYDDDADAIQVAIDAVVEAEHSAWKTKAKDSTYEYTFDKYVENATDEFSVSFTKAGYVKTISVVYDVGDSQKSKSVTVMSDDTPAQIKAKIDAAIAPDVPTKEIAAPLSYEYNGWVKNGEGNYEPTFERYVTVDITIKRNSAVKDTTFKILLQDDEHTDTDVINALKGFFSYKPAQLSCTLAKKGDDAGVYTYNNNFVKDGSSFVPVFKRTIKAYYGDENDDYVEVEIETDDTASEIKTKIDAALTAAGVALPTKADNAPYSYEYGGWSEGADGKWTPEFDKFVNVDVTYKEGDTEKNESFKIPVDDVATDAQVADSIKNYLDGQNPVVEPVNAAAGADGYAYVGWTKDEENKKFIPVFEKDIHVVYGEGENENTDVSIAYGDDEDAIKQKIEETLTAAGVTLPLTKDDDAPYS
ncbi:MAG: InlB B-repeat-containing protein, partial [Fibrobacteraceae bacterium]|nr:InlB B-repeat-containing protein [Fibrobacteraceae bacterium]